MVAEELSSRRKRVRRAKEQRMEFQRISHRAVHEAGHAVVAAYLRLPLDYVTLRPVKGREQDTGGHMLENRSRGVRLYFLTRRGSDEYRQRTRQELKDINKKLRANCAIMILAARAAVEAEPWESFDGRHLEASELEDGYRVDDEQVKGIANELSVADFAAWRKQILDRARYIVSIPYVRQTILLVASRLELELSAYKEKFSDGHVTAKEVRRLLRGARDRRAT
jgi:hypothetical protein